MCSKHVEAWNKLIIKFSASSCLILRNKYIEMHGLQNIKMRWGVIIIKRLIMQFFSNSLLRSTNSAQIFCSASYCRTFLIYVLSLCDKQIIIWIILTFVTCIFIICVMNHILCINCLLQQFIEGKKKGQIEVTRRRGRRRKKPLDNLKDRRGYCQLKEEALDSTMWRNPIGRGFGPVFWQITDDDDDDDDDDDEPTNAIAHLLLLLHYTNYSLKLFTPRILFNIYL